MNTKVPGTIKIDRDGRQYFEDEYGCKDYNGTPAWNKTKGPNFPESYMNNFQSGFAAIMKMRLTGRQYDVLMYLFSKSAYKNYVTINQSEMARQLGMKPQDAHAALNRLIELGIVARDIKDGVSNVYRISHTLAWKGPADTYYDHLKQLKVADIKSKQKSDNAGEFFPPKGYTD